MVNAGHGIESREKPGGRAFAMRYAYSMVIEFSVRGNSDIGALTTCMDPKIAFGLGKGGFMKYICLAFLLSGCSGTIKKIDVARELGAIIEQNDCPAACAALKIYIREKLK